jgi:hypothetical protein
VAVASASIVVPEDTAVEAKVAVAATTVVVGVGLEVVGRTGVGG